MLNDVLLTTLFDRSLQDQLEDAKAKYCEKHGLDTRQALEEELARALEIKRLEERAKDFCTKYGFDISTKDYDEALRILEQQYQKLEASLSDSRKSLQSLESVSHFHLFVKPIYLIMMLWL